ncbi:MAG TPA: GntR family transcriptional regulator [Acetobacteraceae bacterium]|nr:GntR family transcriptional regulator [Acetobacteraceae bacterium]
MWEALLTRQRPIYQTIVEPLRRDLAAGTLVPGVRLPIQRALAERLGVTVGTVTKGYTEAERRGLVVSRVGRGPHVLQPPETRDPGDSRPSGTIGLSVNVSTIEPFDMVLNQVLGASRWTGRWSSTRFPDSNGTARPARSGPQALFALWDQPIVIESKDCDRLCQVIHRAGTKITE